MEEERRPIAAGEKTESPGTHESCKGPDEEQLRSGLSSQMMINDADQSLYVFQFLTLNVNAFIFNWEFNGVFAHFLHDYLCNM